MKSGGILGATEGVKAGTAFPIPVGHFGIITERVETLRRQTEEERKNLDERESQILEVEETLIDRLNQISVRETELEQREENLG